MWIKTKQIKLAELTISLYDKDYIRSVYHYPIATAVIDFNKCTHLPHKNVDAKMRVPYYAPIYNITVFGCS